MRNISHHDQTMTGTCILWNDQPRMEINNETVIFEFDWNDILGSHFHLCLC